MYPIAHAWLVEQIIPMPSPAHYLGCVWPDMLYESPLTHAQSHRSGERLVAHAQTLADGDVATVFCQFVVGVLSHGSEPHGFDWYSDEQYGDGPADARGYAFQHGLGIAAQTAIACGVVEELGWWKAHNIIEMAFERSLALADPTRCDRLANACSDGDLIACVASVLADVFDVPAAHLARAMSGFRTVVQFHPMSAAALAQMYAVQVRAKHAGAKPDADAIARLITHAEELIAHDKDEYLTQCVEWVGAMIRATSGS